MINLDETFFLNFYYLKHKDFYFKGFFYAIGVVTVLNILRAQVSEVNLLQLVPGVYLFLLFIFLLLILLFSSFFLQVGKWSDITRSFGLKTSYKPSLRIMLKGCFIFLFGTLSISLNTLVPLSLDSFYSYGEKTLENVWSFDQVLFLELLLLIILTTLSQFPIFGIFTFNNENDLTFLPKYWKNLSFFIFVLAGIVTPTIDGYTQLSFAASAVSLYLIVINIVEKRISPRFNGLSLLNF